MNSRDYLILQLAEELLATPADQLSDRERRIIDRAVSRQRNPLPPTAALDERLSWPDRLADRVAAIGGSWSFIVGFGLVLAAWTGINALLLTRPFDPYPFIFLNLLLSMLAAIQAPVIMMSQNRMAESDRKQARRDFEINLKAEFEILALHAKLDLLLQANGIDPVHKAVTGHKPA
ncbi:DUF1003 domain-containing protein [Sphingosinicella sp. BN140058]|uniref:DUF1003 domain-containing protein n=1 Tax=Sphingosinicella sp. BN140058 TaxID=1892855 RepID=UPI0010117161|nr:DUF1003 domain-containing protein [Sphingosinicella sp. BN140058]QAY78215.1 DUF1003 domain-containing protein [Sphingosinicella sp. BN140058]